MQVKIIHGFFGGPKDGEILTTTIEIDKEKWDCTESIDMGYAGYKQDHLKKDKATGFLKLVWAGIPK